MKKNRKENACWQLIRKSLEGNRFQVMMLVLLCFAGALLPSITPLVYRQIVDQLIPSRDFVALYIYVVILIAIPVFNSLLFNWRNIVAYRLSEAVTRTLRFALFDKIAKMNYGAYLHMGSKSLVYRLTRGCGQIGDVFLNNTLLDLILRFYEPTSGEILLDGVNVREYDISAYRAQFSVAQQSHFLWNDTLLGNIIYPDEKPRQDDYEQAVANAHMTEFVNRLPQKDQTPLGEGRQAVSGGERQRISLAHAFYQDRRILLLDEPTSALDAETEGYIRNVLLSYKGKKTIIVVTHRLSTILQYDRILVVKNGKIAESGAPDELLGRSSILRGLCEQQGLVIAGAGGLR